MVGRLHSYKQSRVALHDLMTDCKWDVIGTSIFWIYFTYKYKCKMVLKEMEGSWCVNRCLHCLKRGAGLSAIEGADWVPWRVQAGCHRVCRLDALESADWVPWRVQTGCLGECRLGAIECADWVP